MEKLSSLLREGKRVYGTLLNRIEKQNNLYLHVLIIMGILASTAVSSAEAESKQPALSLVKLNKESPMAVTGNGISKISFRLGPSNQKVRLIAAINRGRNVVTRERVEEKSPSLEEKRKIYQDIAAKYGIDPKILESVHQIESGKAWGSTRRSSAGATGPMQFMPGTWRTYQEDGNGDGQANINDPIDALHGAAKLLSNNGASSGNVRGALYRYNHSQAYVNQVLAIAKSIK